MSDELLRKAREALEPFAEEVPNWDGVQDDTTIDEALGMELTVGDLRRALEAWKALDPLEGTIARRQIGDQDA